MSRHKHTRIETLATIHARLKNASEALADIPADARHDDCVLIRGVQLRVGDLRAVVSAERLLARELRARRGRSVVDKSPQPDPGEDC